MCPPVKWNPMITLSFQQFDKIKADNEKLKAENRALTRVVSKLSK